MGVKFECDTLWFAAVTIDKLEKDFYCVKKKLQLYD